MSLVDIKKGVPVTFTVNHLDPNPKYNGMSFSVQIIDISVINDDPVKTNSPPVRGLERTIVTVNPQRTMAPVVPIGTSPVPLEIRPELEWSIRIHARSYGFHLTETTYVYPE